MKKLTILAAILLAMAMAFAFAACGEEEPEVAEDYDDSDMYVVNVADNHLSFETVDLEGNEASSEDLFAENKVNMVNIWGTYCGPCIEEMPEIEQIHQDYADKGVAIFGLVNDVSKKDDSTLQDAFDIISDTGVTYRNLYWVDSLDQDIDFSAVPTTLFVDSEGNLLGDAIVGADPDAYRAALDQYVEKTK